MENYRFRTPLRFLLLTTTLSLLASCSWNDMSYGPSEKFLFIPVDGENTACVSFGTVLLFIIAYAIKFFLAGRYRNEITRDVRDNHGNKIGTIGTGEYTHHTISQMDADDYCWWIKTGTTVAVTIGCILSWFIKSLGWITILSIVISWFLIRLARRNDVFDHYVQIWGWILIAISVICMFVYW